MDVNDGGVYGLISNISGASLFRNGIPHFWETSKQDKQNGDRLDAHVVAAIVHGSSTRVFVSYEHLASDPNFTIEVSFHSRHLIMKIVDFTGLSTQQNKGIVPDSLRGID